MAQSLIAMILPASVDASAALRGVLAALHVTSFAQCLFEAEATSPALLADLRSYLEQHRPNGAILLPPLSDDSEVIALCLELGCNTVRLSSGARAGPVPTICSNHRQAAADATNYLIAISHQRIAFIAGPVSCGASRECELGYIDALAAQGPDRGAELVAASDGSFTSGQAAAVAV